MQYLQFGPARHTRMASCTSSLRQLKGPLSAPAQRPSRGSPKRLGWLRACATTTTEERQNRKELLLEALDLSTRLRRLTSKGADVEAAMNALCEVGGQVTAADLGDGRLTGRFENISFFTRNATGDDATTCGILTFGNLQPRNLKIRVLFVEMEAGEPSSDDGSNYRVTTTFEVAEGEHLGLQGKSTVKGRATLSEDPSHANRQHISFQGVAIRPVDPHQLDSWLGAFQQANPTMDGSGVLDIAFPEAAEGYRDIIYIDDDFQVSVGNRAGTTFMRRIA